MNDLLLTITLNLIGELSILRSTELPLYKNVSIRTLELLTLRIRLQLVIEELYTKTSLLRTNILLSVLEEHILY